MAHPTTTRARKKPVKPRPDLPLWIHPSGRWCKKVRGRAHYFGKVADDPNGQAALERWLEVKDDLLAGRTPRAAGDCLIVRDLANRFLVSKKILLDAGEIATKTWRSYYATCERLIRIFGRNRLVTDLAADDFESLRVDMSKTMGPTFLKVEIQRTRSVFKYAYEAGLIDRPVRFGPTFKAPSQRVLQKARKANGSRMFEASEIRMMLEAANSQAIP